MPRKTENLIPMHSFHAEKARLQNLCGQHFRDARRQLGLTQGELCQRLSQYGVDVQPPAISKWEKGENIPNFYQGLALCLALDIKEGFQYFTGISDQPDLNPQGQQFLAEFQNFLLSTGRYSTVKAMPSSPEPGMEKLVPFPFAQLPASAGTGEYLLEEAFEMREFPESRIPKDANFALAVHGDSMEPEFHDGQTVFIKKGSELYEGQVGLFILNGSGYIKVYGIDRNEKDLSRQGPAQVLISLNKKYAPIQVHPYDDLRIVGRVLKQEEAL